MSVRKSLYLLSHDLRLKDNLVLNTLVRQCDSIAFLYVFNPAWLEKCNYGHRLIGEHQLNFIIESLIDLECQLHQLGHKLYTSVADPIDCIPAIINSHGITDLATSTPIGFYEQQQWHALKKQLSHITVTSDWNNTLLTEQALTDNQLFEQVDSPESFSQFRRRIEANADVIPPCKSWLDSLPHPFQLKFDTSVLTVSQLRKLLEHNHRLKPRLAETTFVAGEHAGQSHLSQYFSSAAPSTYKQTRNELDGWTNSTKFSPYLANGNLSPRQIWNAVSQYERDVTKNDSTYWIKFELLWREYFHWLALQQQARSYDFSGLAKARPLTSFYPERFNKWCQGNTPYPIVNACMNQLNATGFMSNRGRQIVASCLVNELQVDWRYGAAYFQQMLVDHDVASNWGNWQYIAGVGVDPRGGRQFNLAKQTDIYDAKKVFITKWQGAATQPTLDSVDAVDWPAASPVEQQ